MQYRFALIGLLSAAVAARAVSQAPASHVQPPVILNPPPTLPTPPKGGTWRQQPSVAPGSPAPAATDRDKWDDRKAAYDHSMKEYRKAEREHEAAMERYEQDVQSHRESDNAGSSHDTGEGPK
jgi:hypothetical protein